MTKADTERSTWTDEQRYRLLADNPRDVVYRTDAAGVVIWVSDSCALIFGWGPELVVGRTVGSLVHPQDAEETDRNRAALTSGNRESELIDRIANPIRVHTSTGEYRWVSPIAVPVYEDGAYSGVVGRLRDIHELVTAIETARSTKELASTTFASLLDPVLVMAPVYSEQGEVIDFSYLDANPAACAYNDMTYEQMVGARLLDINPGNVETGVFARLVEVLRTGHPLILDNYAYDQELRGGERRYYDLRVARAGEVLVYTWRDATDRQRAELDMAAREDLYRLVTEDVTDAVVRFDEKGLVTWASPSFEHLTGYAAEAIIGRSGLSLLVDGDTDANGDLMRRRLAGEDIGSTVVRLKRADGTARWVHSRSRPFMRNDQTTDGFVSVLRDITNEFEAQQQLEHDVGHDSLTGLANRSLAAARIDRALDELGGSRRFLAVLNIGVDRLTTVNQALNYAAGDLVLNAVASRITAAVGDPDRVARVAGDEFTVLVTDLASPAEAASMAERLCAAARGPLDISGQTIEPTVSVGVVIGDRGTAGEELLSRASLGVRQAKEAGRNRWQFVDPNIAHDAQRRLQIEAQLREVVRDNLVVPWFQPVVTLADRRLRGYEALARWDGPGHESATPDDFLPVAEGTGLIVDVDLSILRKAVDLLTVINVEHVAVNVSPPSLASGAYAEGFAAVMATSGVDPTRIRLEVTETALIGESGKIAAAMQSVADLGATWYVDDFGTGFSSISHLRDLPVHGLKLDRSFTAGIRGGDPTCIKLAQGLIGLAVGLGLDTIAEGIETEFEAGALLGQGWHQGQGWLFGRPMSRDSVPRP